MAYWAHPWPLPTRCQSHLPTSVGKTKEGSKHCQMFPGGKIVPLPLETTVVLNLYTNVIWAIVLTEEAQREKSNIYETSILFQARHHIHFEAFAVAPEWTGEAGRAGFKSCPPASAWPCLGELFNHCKFMFIPRKQENFSGRLQGLTEVIYGTHFQWLLCRSCLWVGTFPFFFLQHTSSNLVISDRHDATSNLSFPAFLMER